MQGRGEEELNEEDAGAPLMHGRAGGVLPRPNALVGQERKMLCRRLKSLDCGLRSLYIRVGWATRVVTKIHDLSRKRGGKR